jgi:hypothetical protein
MIRFGDTICRDEIVSSVLLEHVRSLTNFLLLFVRGYDLDGRQATTCLDFHLADVDVHLEVGFEIGHRPRQVQLTIVVPEQLVDRST